MSSRNEEIAMGEGDFQIDYLKEKFLPKANVLHFAPTHPHLPRHPAHPIYLSVEWNPKYFIVFSFCNTVHTSTMKRNKWCLQLIKYLRFSSAFNQVRKLFFAS